jgi:hypothetical protein
MQFRRRSHQGFKKSARIKLLDDNNVWGQDPVDHSNNIIIAVKDEKMLKCRKGPPTKWLLLLLLYTKSGGETDFQAKKSHIVVPGLVFVEGYRNRLRWHLILELLMAQRHQDNLAAFVFSKYSNGGPFLC